jgi:AraC-like DNA-binding protein
LGANVAPQGNKASRPAQKKRRERTFYPENEKTVLRPDQLEKMEMAREILEANLQNPPQINELARMIGMCETFLKIYFKVSYGCTVGSFVIDQRMILARKLLEEGELNVSEIAWEVGYKHTTHFSAAFKKATGMSPKVFARIGQVG